MILGIDTEDKRFPLSGGSGSDAIHCDPIYSYAVTNLVDDSGIIGQVLPSTSWAKAMIWYVALELFTQTN